MKRDASFGTPYGAPLRFTDRGDAGRQLAHLLDRYREMPGVVYALPRGGVVTAAEVANYLAMPLDLVIPRKIGHPLQPEYAICAVAESGEIACNPREIERVDPQWLARAVDGEKREAQRRRALYAGAAAPIDVSGRTAIVVDDGIATGLTMEAAILDVRARKPARIVVAVPVTPRDTADRLRAMVDDFVAVRSDDFFLGAVGAYYDRFAQVSDDEVVALMRPGRSSR
jgi:putative phosphoribosyl transferase